MRGPQSSTPPLAPRATVSLSLHPRLGSDWPPSGLGPIGRLVEELPDPAELAPGSWVAISAGQAPKGKGLARLLTRRSSPGVHLAVRCTALLARGYEQVCTDCHGTAYGQVP